MDCSPPGSSVHRIFQARVLEWVAISYSRGSFWPRAWTRIPASPAWQANSLPPATFYNALLKGFNKTFVQLYLASLMAQQQRIHTCNAGDTGNVGSISGSGRSLGEGNGNPLQYFAWEISWAEEPGSLQSMGSQESDTTERLKNN